MNKVVLVKYFKDWSGDYIYYINNVIHFTFSNIKNNKYTVNKFFNLKSGIDYFETESNIKNDIYDGWGVIKDGKFTSID